MPWRRERPSLRCRLGWHAPRPGALWNEGYYFTRCARCGADLVRTTFSGWEAPRGYRVVWRAKPLAEEALSPPPPRSLAAAAPPPLPRQPEELRPSETRPHVRRTSSIPDFMNEPSAPATPETPAAPPTGLGKNTRARS